jgi:hypothetical protein
MRSIVGGLCIGCLVLGLPTLVRSDDTSPMAIIDKAIEATGGAQNLSKRRAESFKGKGTFHGLGQAIEFGGEWWIQPPDKFKNVINVDAGGQKFEIVQVVSGNKGWRSMMGNVEEMTEEQLGEAKEELYASRIAQLTPLKDADVKLTPLGASKVGDKEVLGVKVSSKNHKDISLFFDKKTGLLVKSQHRAKDQMSQQEVERDTIYSDYKEQDGIKLPMKISTKQDGKDYVDMAVSEYKLVDKLDDKLFTKPAG